jgi:hypothetical protein
MSDRSSQSHKWDMLYVIKELLFSIFGIVFQKINYIILYATV